MSVHNRRCRNCGQYTHPVGQLPPACLVDELTHHHSEGTANGPGLYVQLIHALGDPRRREPGAPSAHQKPGSRPPGWRADISELLAVMRKQGFGWRSSGWLEFNVKQGDLEQWVLQARQSLGLVTPSVLLDEVSCARRVLTSGGYVWAGCGHVSLRVAQDAQSDVWCSRPDCHDDHRYPDCRDLNSTVDALGYPLECGYAPPPLLCRRTERDLRHAMRWRREEWHLMLDQAA